MHFGHFKLAVDTVWGTEQARTAVNVPIVADGVVTYRVYDAEGNLLASGNCTTFDSPTLTGSYKFAFTTASPTFERGKSYLVKVQYTVSGGAARSTDYRFNVT